MAKARVVLFGASGTMGFEAFKELWRWHKFYDITLLVRPSRANRERFRRYARQAKLPYRSRSGVSEGQGLRIIWGDATRYEDVELAIRGADVVLDAMAYISPQADYHPEIARAVNTDAIGHIVRAIEAQPQGAERIRLIYTGTVAATGDRLPPIHHGRVGDPLKSSIFDYYATTKIAGERLVLESNIRHWVSLRMTFIMPTRYKALFALQDPIAFHMPINSFMECITDRDAGYGLVNCVRIPPESDFWRRVYNMGGGPGMRCSAYDYLDRSFKLLGLSGIEACTERRWYALRNFHMQYFDDSWLLNDYLQCGRDTLDTYWELVAKDMPPSMRTLAGLCRRSAGIRRCVEGVAYRRLQRMVENHRNGTGYWYAHRNDARISAFYGDYAAYEAIPAWGERMPPLDPEPDWHPLEHGYDENKRALALEDLQAAARFRGGACLASAWDGDLFAPLEWRCARGHTFAARPNTVLMTGHWCPACVPPPWDYDTEARLNPFFAQVWYSNHAASEQNYYAQDCMRDIVDADKD